MRKPDCGMPHVIAFEDDDITGLHIIAPKAPLFQRPKVSNVSCVSARASQILVIFAGTDCTAPAPFSRSCHFNLDFRESLKMTKKTSKSYLREASRRTPFWDPFLSFFSEKVQFSPRRVRPLFASLRRNPARRVNLVSKNK